MSPHGGRAGTYVQAWKINIKKAANSITCTAPCRIFVRAQAKVTTLTASVTASRRLLALASPRKTSRRVKQLITSMIGTVSPMVESTDPRKILIER